MVYLVNMVNLSLDTNESRLVHAENTVHQVHLVVLSCMDQDRLVHAENTLSCMANSCVCRELVFIGTCLGACVDCHVDWTEHLLLYDEISVSTTNNSRK